MMDALDTVREIELHDVAQVIETEFIVGSVRNIGTIGFSPFIVIQAVPDNPDAQSKKFVEPAHPLRVAARQVIIDGDDVNTLAFKGIQVRGKRCNQRFTFTGFHL